MILRIYVNDIDITSSVQMKSVKIQSSTGNRRNTASFIVNDYQINEAQEIEIFKGSTLSAGISAGVSSFTIDDSDSDLVNNISYFLRAGDKVILGYRTANEERVTIDHISGSTVYITGVTARSHSLSDMIGGKLFAGITLKNPREEIGKSEMMTFSVDATDYSTILDAQNVVDTWEGVNSREILSRIVYLFTSVDSSVTLSSCETLTGLTSSGVAVTPTLNSTDKVFQNYSINIGASGAGSGVYTWTFSAINVSAMDIARLWINTPATPSSYISAMTYRIVDGSGNSYTWTANVGSGGWGYDSGRFSDAVVSGAINLSAIVKFEILFTALQAIPIGTFKIDHILATKGGFTLKNTDPGNVIFADVRSQYKKPTVLIEDIAKANGFFWYVDADKDIHFFSAEDRTAPETLTDVSTNFNKLKITADITNLRNRQTIRGGMAPEETLYPQEKVLDGKETSYRLDYPPKDLKVYLDTGAGYVLKTVGIENIVDETTVDFVMNFSEKTVRNGSIATQVAGTKIKLEYYPYKDIRVQRRDQVSIDNMKLLLGGDGIFDGPVINDESIRTFDDARARAKAELTAYSNPVLTATFDTERDGLEVGQIINISSTKYGTASGFVIQKITANQKDNEGGFTYSITCGSTLYGLTEFFQYILKKASKGEIDVNELVDVVTTVDETLVMGDALTYKVKSAPFFVTPPNPVETLKVGEIAEYPFYGNANDRSGNGYNGTVTGATLTTDRFGNTDSAYAFDGTDDRINFAGLSTNGGNFSVICSCYIGNTQPSNFRRIIAEENGSNSRFAILIGSSANNLGFNVRDTVGNKDNYTNVSTGWHHCGITFDGINARYYLDGNLFATRVTNGNLIVGNSSIYIAGAVNGAAYNGKVSDARIFNRQLTDQEILFLYQNPRFYKNSYQNKHTHLSGNLVFGINNITVNGASAFQTDYFGDSNSAYSFDGNDLITKTGLFTGMGQEFTLSAMCYPTNVTPATPFKIITSSTNQMGISINSSTKRFDFHVYDTNYRIFSPSFVPSINTWYHVGMTYKNNVLTAYIDGVNVGTLAVTGPIVAGTDAHIGNRASLVEGFIGKIDEWDFEFTARDDAGMLELYKSCTIANDGYADFCIAT